MLPLQIKLVAIPEGSEPTLRILSAHPEVVPDLEVAPVPRLRVEHHGAEMGLAPRRPSAVVSPKAAGRARYQNVYEPDPEIYEILLRRYGLDPTGTVFIDDSADNVSAARALGFEAVHFTSAAELRSRLRRLDLL